MSTQPVSHCMFVIERSFPTTPDRVFAAFADPAKKSRWYADGRGMGVERFEMDFRVGGTDHTHYRTTPDSPLKGASISNDTWYQDIVPNQRIVIAYTMSVGDQRISASLATFELSATASGTTLLFTEQAAFLEGADGPEMRKAGWTSLIDKLAASLED